jgi:hypothetical protein
MKILPHATAALPADSDRGMPGSIFLMGRSQFDREAAFGIGSLAEVRATKAHRVLETESAAAWA